MKPKNIGKVILAGLVITFLARDSVGRGDDGESEHYEYKCNDCDRVDTEETDYSGGARNYVKGDEDKNEDKKNGRYNEIYYICDNCYPVKKDYEDYVKDDHKFHEDGPPYHCGK